MRLLVALTVACLVTPPVVAQGMLESGGVRAFSAGLGAGLAGSLGHGAFVRQSYEAGLEAQKAIAEQTKAINDYAVRGAQFETKQQWAYAEMAYKYVLSLISHRDGPGSANSLPVLAHLSKITKQEHKLDDAISYQKTVVALTQASKKLEPKALLAAQRDLSGLFIEKRDYPAAKNALQREVALFDRYPSLPREELSVSMEVYGKVLQRLGEPSGSSAPPSVAGAYNEIPPTTTASTGTVPPSTEPAVVNLAHASEPISTSPIGNSGSASADELPPSAMAPAKFLEQPKPESPTADQEQLSKAHLFGAEPLPSEVELRQQLYGTPDGTKPNPANDSASSPTSTNMPIAPKTETQAPSDSPAK
ncbi:MAG TPA: hypothetical protein V6D22_26355 [Candidatus Obscuribacterales bacterium]